MLVFLQADSLLRRHDAQAQPLASRQSRTPAASIPHILAARPLTLRHGPWHPVNRRFRISHGFPAPSHTSCPNILDLGTTALRHGPGICHIPNLSSKILDAQAQPQASCQPVRTPAVVVHTDIEIHPDFPDRSASRIQSSSHTHRQSRRHSTICFLTARWTCGAFFCRYPPFSKPSLSRCIPETVVAPAPAYPKP